MNALEKPNFERKIADNLGLPIGSIQKALQLLEEGNTIPFIARYRKEMTGKLDEVQLRDISRLFLQETKLHERKLDVLRLIEEQGVFNDDELKAKITSDIVKAQTLSEVDDVYRPYRKARKTRSSMAKEQGLLPLYLWLVEKGQEHHFDEQEIVRYAMSFVDEQKGVLKVDDALQGAMDIFAQIVADDPAVRRYVRSITLNQGSLCAKGPQEPTLSVYDMYYNYEEKLSKIPHYRVLAMNRGERDGILSLSIIAPQKEIIAYLNREFNCSSAWLFERMQVALLDSYTRLIAPSIERQLRQELTEQAQEHATVIFAKNLRQLLLQPPIRQRIVLGVDPAFRTGCKLAVVDETGKLLAVDVIYPTAPQHKVTEARETVLRLVETHHISLVAIGNGTASRETELFVVDCLHTYQDKTGQQVPYIMVSEAGASVYSASDVAREEFPQLDLSLRSAVSIARRVQDPLAELVKIDPKAIGVGQYQHDIAAKILDDQLQAVVEMAVNEVGVDVNTASWRLLHYVSGLNKTTSKNIVLYREQNGRFRRRKDLALVPRLGAKTFEQCVGFLRIADGEEPFDATPIHVESYAIAKQLLKKVGATQDALSDEATRQALVERLRACNLVSLSEELEVGVPTIEDMITAFAQKGRDVRDNLNSPAMRTDVLHLEDVQVGMMMMGTVRNVVDFGAFVDVGLKQDGLVHISQLTKQYVAHPMNVVAVGDVVTVWVLAIDQERGRLSLTMRKPE